MSPFALAYAIARFLLEVLIVRGKPDAELQSEVLALRHHLRERRVSRARWQPSDRLLLAAISQALPRPAWRSLLPNPDTLLRWHRELVRWKWAAYRRRCRGSAPIAASLSLTAARALTAGPAPWPDGG